MERMKRRRARGDQLFHDFPRDLPLHLRRFDGLVKSGEKDGAATVLADAARFSGESPFVTVRRMHG